MSAHVIDSVCFTDWLNTGTVVFLIHGQINDLKSLVSNCGNFNWLCVVFFSLFLSFSCVVAVFLLLPIYLITSVSLFQRWLVNDGFWHHVSDRSLMPSLATSVVMDTEDFLHPEVPQLGSPKFSAPSPPLVSSMEVLYFQLFVLFWHTMFTVGFTVIFSLEIWR